MKEEKVMNVVEILVRKVLLSCTPIFPTDRCDILRPLERYKLISQFVLLRCSYLHQICCEVNGNWTVDRPPWRPIFCDMQNASGQKQRQMCGCVGRRVIWRQALIGRRVANHQGLFPEQRLAELLLPPVIHLCGKVVRVSSKQLVPTPLQQDAVLENTEKMTVWPKIITNVVKV